jgi:hypothetical protein
MRLLNTNEACQRYRKRLAHHEDTFFRDDAHNVPPWGAAMASLDVVLL